MRVKVPPAFKNPNPQKLHEIVGQHLGLLICG